MLDGDPLRGHRPGRRREAGSQAARFGLVHGRPVPLDEERPGRRRDIGAVHHAGASIAYTGEERGAYPDLSAVRSPAPEPRRAPSSAREWMPSFE